MDDRVLLRVQNLRTYFPVKSGISLKPKRFLKAVDDVSFTIAKGKTVGLVGESGCGKTTLGRSILRLLEPTSGNIFFSGKSIIHLQNEEMRKMRRHMQIIFQNPYSSLNPRISIGEIVKEGLKLHKLANVEDLDEKVGAFMEKVGLSSMYMDRFPRELSGGQRQRIAIARAVILNPSFIVCDEPVSALDVSIQSQILNLLMELKEEFKLSYLFISHDLSVVECISDRVMVMYLGQIVESAPSNAIYKNTKHPYTKALISAIPIANPKQKNKQIILSRDPPSPVNPPDGCRFHPRCLEVMPICKTIQPEEIMISSEHVVKCHLYN